MSTITWLHLSDLHLREIERWDEDIVLRALLVDVQERITSDGLRPDFIVVSGDIAFSGLPDEYALARQFFDELLKATGLPKTRLFVVPGNHDVDRQAISRGAIAIASSLDSRQAVNEVLTVAEDRRLIFRKFNHYADFVGDYFGGRLVFDDERYFYVQPLDLADRRVTVLGLNSAWLAYGGDEDRGRLALGERQVRQALEAAREADLRIALLHHPFDWFQGFDRNDCEALLMQLCEFVLHGHLHRTGLLSLTMPDAGAMIVAAGASYARRDYPNSYNFVRLDFGTGQGTVHLRTYSDQRGGFWTKDVMTYQNVDDGRYTFKLPPSSGAALAESRREVSSIPTGDLRRATERYLQHLVDRYHYLDFKGMGVSDRVPLRLSLVSMYVPLKARVELPEGETWVRDLRLAGRKLPDETQEVVGERMSEPQPVADLLQENDGLIVLGDPGAGKTTFLKYVAVRLALGEGEALNLGARLPVLLPLSAYANALAEQDVPLDRFIADYYRSRGVDLPLQPMLDEALKRGGAVVLLDGLDEVKDRSLRHLVLERVVDFYTFHRRQGNKFVLTSRIVGYREVRPTAEGMAECTLVDFDDEEIELFVQRWTQAIEDAARGKTPVAAQEADRERKELLEAVHRNPGVRRLAANPLLLTILALMKRQGVTLPERRVELYQKYVETLLSTWNRARGLGRPPVRDLDVVETVRILAPLALWMHQVASGVGLVKQGDLQRQLAEIYAGRGETDPEMAARRFLADVREHAGLLLERGTGTYGFIHLTFEEYLAAVAVAQKGQRDVEPVVEVLAEYIGNPAWREVILLTIGYLGIVQQRDEAAGAVVGALIEQQPGESGQAVAVAGEAVVDAWPGGVTPACREQVVRRLVEAIRDDERVKPTLRAAAGDALARLGDPRPGVGLRADGLPDIAWCEVPAGPFIMGSDKRRDPEAYDDELPQHEVTLPAYSISKYPVTNTQYVAFVAAGGYQERRYWTRAGWEWKGERTTPETYGGVFDLPNHPVVMVTWYEAIAFCRWLTERLHEAGQMGSDQEVMLSNEAQWEKAARGEGGRIYPWGNEFDAAKCNMRDTGIGTTSAVGIFPDGASPYGVEDLSGNVDEWCRTRWRDSYQEPADESLEGDVLRVVRGGAFFSYARGVRCACRGGYFPDSRWSYRGGFRVVLVAPGFSSGL